MLLFPEMEVAPQPPTFDLEKQWWLIATNRPYGKIHLGMFPWLPYRNCATTIHVRSLIISWGDRSSVTCTICRKRPSHGLEDFVPPGFRPFCSRTDTLVSADWWAERGIDYRAHFLKDIAKRDPGNYTVSVVGNIKKNKIKKQL